jgi:hypothetical protein
MRTTCRFPDDINRRLHKIADAYGISVNALVTMAVVEFLVDRGKRAGMPPENVAKLRKSYPEGIKTKPPKRGK